MNAVLLNESCAAIGITVSGQTPEVLRALGAAKEKGASTILFDSPQLQRITMPSAMKSCCLRSKSI